MRAVSKKHMSSFKCATFLEKVFIFHYQNNVIRNFLGFKSYCTTSKNDVDDIQKISKIVVRFERDVIRKKSIHNLI